MSCDPCCTTPSTTQIAGAAGQPAWTTVTPLGFTVPALAGSLTINFGNTDWMVTGENIFIAGAGTFSVTTIVDSLNATVLYLDIPANTASGNAIAAGAKVGATGLSSDGADGVDAFTVTSANFVVPAISATVSITVANSSWLAIGQTVFVEGAGFFEVTAKADAQHFTGEYLDVAGNTHATETITSGAQVSAGGVSAPPVLTTKGDLYGRSTVDARIPVGINGQSLFADSAQTLGLKWAGGVQTLNVNTTPVSNAGTAETDLMTYTVPAGLLTTNGDSLEIECMFEFAANANLKTVKFKFGSTTVFTIGPTAQNGDFLLIRARIVRTGAATQVVYAQGFTTTGEAMADSTVTGGTAAETLSGTVTLKATGESGTASTDITQNTMITTYRSV